MRIVFVGAGSAAVATARQLIGKGHEVVIIERDSARIQELSSELDCGFIHGDGTRPGILREADTGSVDALLCLTAMDQENIISSLVGKVEKIPHIVTKIEDPQFEKVAIALGLENIVLPAQAMARHLVDIIEAHDTLESSPVIKGDARVFSFLVSAEQDGTLKQLDLPATARAMCMYRKGKMAFIDKDTHFREGDEVVVLAHADVAADLQQRLTLSPKS